MFVRIEIQSGNHPGPTIRQKIVHAAGAEFQQAVDSFDGVLEKEGVSQMAALCIEDGFPRLEDYLPTLSSSSVKRLTLRQKEERRAVKEQESIAQRKLTKDVHVKFREAHGMPPAWGD